MYRVVMFDGTDKEIMADSFEVGSSGELFFYDERRFVVRCIAPDIWEEVFTPDTPCES